MLPLIETLWSWICTADEWLLMVPIALVFILASLANKRGGKGNP